MSLDCEMNHAQQVGLGYIDFRKLHIPTAHGDFPLTQHNQELLLDAVLWNKCSPNRVKLSPTL